MPIIQKALSIAANANLANILAGEFFEFVPYNALVEVGFNQNTGAAGNILVDFISGSDVVAKDYTPLIKTTAPIYPDEFTLQDIAGMGERLVLAVRNTTAGAIVVMYTVRISAV